MTQAWTRMNQPRLNLRAKKACQRSLSPPQLLTYTPNTSCLQAANEYLLDTNLRELRYNLSVADQRMKYQTDKKKRCKALSQFYPCGQGSLRGAGYYVQIIRLSQVRLRWRLFFDLMLKAIQLLALSCLFFKIFMTYC